MSPTQMQAMQDVAVMVESVQDSKALAKRHGPKVILSASGMATGGRVLHHLGLYLPDHRNMVILTGYQAPGTRGASLASGQARVRIHGRDVDVKAEVVCMASASAHADSVQLLQWLSRMPKPPVRCMWCTAKPQPATLCVGRLNTNWAGAPGCPIT